MTFTQSLDIELTTESPTQEVFILAQLERLTLVFPSSLVADTFLIERSQILPLPFYHPAILGCVQHAGTTVPLVALHKILGIAEHLGRETSAIVRLSNLAATASGIGLLVNKVLGRQSREQLPLEVFDAFQAASTDVKLFQPEILEANLWQPQRWQAHSLSPTALMQ